MIAFTVFAINFTSCKKDDVYEPEPEPEVTVGWLLLSNKSSNTIQKITIDGSNYGTIYPGKEEIYELYPGKYEVKIEGVNREGGCSPFFVTIIAGATQAYSCSG